jgi:hypothetical protein|nr:MAG TPA: DNA POLYMERASE [Caudoviricetes sp.]
MKRTEITLDFETYYDKKSKYFLKKKNSGLTIEQYIRNPKFEVIGSSVKVGNRPAEWLCPHEIEDWLKHVEAAYGWDNVRLIAHNGRFDCAILGWIYKIYPGQIADTMLMSRACQLWDGNYLDVVTHQLRDTYGWGIIRDANGNTTWGHLNEAEMLRSLNKGDEVVNADGKHLMDFTDEEYEAYAEYGRTDVDLTWSAYNWFMKEFKFPELEIDVMTATIETFTYPVVELHEPVLKVVRDTVNGKRDALLNKVGATLSDLRSDDKFAGLLRNLGVEPPTKLNAKGQTKYAFAKKDLDFLRLLEHEDPNVVELVEARLGNKSSQAVTRVERFIDLASRGALPIPLEYYAAHTGRWGGCLVADTLVLVKNEREKFIAWKPIVTVSPKELVYDGEEFVVHDGVQYRGDSKVINYNGVVGTPDHLVLCKNGGYYSLDNLRENGTAETSGIAYFPEFVGEDGYVYHGNVFGFEAFHGRRESVYDIVNCGGRHRFAVLTKNGIAVVHNSDAVNVQNMNRNQLVDKTTPVGTKVFYKDRADAVVEVLPDNKVYLARAGVVENDEEELHIMGLRDAIKAPKGKKLVVLDWGQIELRYNSWLWGEQWILDALTSGKDIYKVTATFTYGIEYDEVTKSQRFVGKSQQLGLGYGAGKNGLIVVMGKRSEEFTEQQLQSFVNAYRQSAPNIKRGWDKCKTLLNAMVQGVDVELGDSHGLFYSVGNKIMRPSGLALTYRGVHHRPGEMGNELWFWGKNKQTKKPDWEKTFGGKITENLCIDGEAEVLTDRGWVRLKDIRLTDKVHDGIKFVNHSGLIPKGRKECVIVDGVSMTKDHEVLTVNGWKQAGELGDTPLLRLDERAIDVLRNIQDSQTAGSNSGETGRYKEVYDILNCGPRNRFVVKGKEEPFIVHNCQAACRDIAAEKVVSLRKEFLGRGWSRDDAHIVMTVHDEIIVCCKDELAEEVFDVMQDVMTHSTGWYATLPLAVDGSIAQRYGCAK